MNSNLSAIWSLHAELSLVAVLLVLFLADLFRRPEGNGRWFRVLACVLMIERILHTVYVFTADGLLVINRGRFSRQTVIHVSDILSAEKLRAGVLPVRYVLVRYGAGHEVAVQPVNEDAFIGEIRRRQQETESDFEKQ